MMKSAGYFVVFLVIFFLGIQFGLKIIEPNQQSEISAKPNGETINVVESPKQNMNSEAKKVTIEKQEVMEEDEHFTKKIATFIEKIVASFYNALVTILYQIIELCF